MLPLGWVWFLKLLSAMSFLLYHLNLRITYFSCVLFLSYFSGKLYLDEEKRFYGPHQLRLGLTGMLRFNVYKKFMEAKNKGVDGNLKGDGTLLGGNVLVSVDHFKKNFICIFKGTITDISGALCISLTRYVYRSELICKREVTSCASIYCLLFVSNL